MGEEILRQPAQHGQYPGRILLVDDEINIREGLKAILQKDGHEVRDVGTAVAALDLLSTFAAEVAVLDIRMPGMMGTELLAAVKSQRPYLAVIMLTGHGTLETAMTAVKEGAFDYLLKPARPDTLRAVVWQALAAARRQREQATLLETLQTGLQRLEQLPTTPPTHPAAMPPAGMLKIGDLVIDRATYETWYAGRPLSLTPTEYGLLLALAERGGAVMDYVSLTKIALDYEAEAWEAKELIKRHIYTLRQKIEPQPDQPHFILNVRGVGYRLAA
ncbi:MAG TPA: response regulator transcription factor [Chloroflexota bacterium]|nr:response regulator transcription factor [Chloroflexota bacterium]HUM67295.1 response regulator transcription factor [Chloroflexota bacterium]